MLVYLFDNEKLAESVTPKLSYLLTHIMNESMIDSWVSLFTKNLKETHRLERLVGVLNSTNNKTVAWCLIYFINLSIKGYHSLFKRNAVSESQA